MVNETALKMAPWLTSYTLRIAHSCTLLPFTARPDIEILSILPFRSRFLSLGRETGTKPAVGQQ